MAYNILLAKSDPTAQAHNLCERQTTRRPHQMALAGLDGSAAAADALPTKYFLAVDGGGSSCTAVLLSSAGAISVGEAGPCNV